VEAPVVVGVARIVLALGQSHSLKDKRAIVRKVVDRVRARHSVSIAEVGDHDLWQKATLGLAAVGADTHHVRQLLDEVVRGVEELYVAPIVQCDVQVDTYTDFATGPFEPADGKGPNPFTREVLAGEGEDDDDGIEDAPWAEPAGRPARRS
jgi:uncharacterized protein YlxP (DUF503 family)